MDAEDFRFLLGRSVATLSRGEIATGSEAALERQRPTIKKNEAENITKTTK